MTASTPEILKPLLQEFVSSARRLPGLYALYLEGSIALDGFNERFSDIDFIAMLLQPATNEDFETLKQIHASIEKSEPRWKLSGWYLPFEALKTGADRIEPVLKYHDGVLRKDAPFELQSVEGWNLKNAGIALLGPEPPVLPFTVDWDIILRKIHHNLNTYWASWTRRPEALAAMLSDWGIQWTVLGVLRQFYSFRENSITTKVKAAEYALPLMPLRWQRLIQEALNIRESRKERLYRNRISRMVEAVMFLKFVIELSKD